MRDFMFIEREITEHLRKFADFFPVVAILGPRQSGKTTLVQHVFKDYFYINLENLDVRQLALLDPRGFLEKLLERPGVIIDEFQRAPELLSYLQVIVDREKRPGFFVLTGSQNFLMNEAIGQSLAGRVGILTLLPLSNKEILDAQLQFKFSENAMFKGCYPRLFEEKALDPVYVYPSYIQTYIERDVRSMVNVTDLSMFKKFLGLCAGRVGQLLNVSALSLEAGISMQTVNSWLAILQASYILFLLQPYHNNFNKRLVKSSKLYFYDTGIAASLLGIDNAQQLEQHYLRGAIFENFIIADMYKQFYNSAKTPALYFWRDSHGHEVDCIVEKGTTILPVEIKSGMTLDKRFIEGITYWQELSGQTQGMLVYGGDDELHVKNCDIKSWKKFNIM
jgi:Predicted ATPase (AAA+ superfamily)